MLLYRLLSKNLPPSPFRRRNASRVTCRVFALHSCALPLNPLCRSWVSIELGDWALRRRMQGPRQRKRWAVASRPPAPASRAAETQSTPLRDVSGNTRDCTLSYLPYTHSCSSVALLPAHASHWVLHIHWHVAGSSMPCLTRALRRRR